MSRASVEAVIGRLLLDSTFCKELLANPDAALSVYELTSTEKANIKSIDGETMDVLLSILSSRAGKLLQGHEHADH